MRLESEEKNVEIPDGGLRQTVEYEKQKMSNCETIESRHETMRSIVRSGEQAEAFFLCDRDQLVKNFNYWTDQLPNVTPCFDVSFNSTPMVLSTLSKLGAKFNCQNKVEMEQLSKIGMLPQDILFGNSTKVASHIRFAANFGVELMEFENLAEIKKIQKSSPKAKLVYRLNFPFENGANFSTGNFIELLTGATAHGLQVVGVSVNVTDSGVLQYQKAISIARLAFALGKNLGHTMTRLDMGELSPALNNLKEFEQLACAIQSCVYNQFKSLDNFADLNIFAHPSNFFVESSFSLAAKIVGKRVSRLDGKVTYVINDGIFGAFGRLLQDDIALQPIPLGRSSSDNLPLMVCDIFGPSGHDMDQICYGHLMSSIEIGEWLVFDNMGAFTIADWESNAIDGNSKVLGSSGTFLASNNLWFFSRRDELGVTDSDDSGVSDCDKSGSASDDEELLLAFYQLPQNEDDENEQRLCSMLR